MNVCLSFSHFHCIVWHDIAGFETKCRCILSLIARLSLLAVVGIVQCEDSTLLDIVWTVYHLVIYM